MLKEQKVGANTADVYRKNGISAATFYKFKAKFDGMKVSDARRLKAPMEAGACSSAHVRARTDHRGCRLLSVAGAVRNAVFLRIRQSVVAQYDNHLR